MQFWWWIKQHLWSFLVVQGRISGTRLAARLVSLALAITLISWYSVLNCFRAFPSGLFLQFGMSDPMRSLISNVFLPHP